MLSIDLKDACFQIPIYLDFQLYLRFCFEGCVYQFRALCFCLSMAPRVFTGVFSLILEWAHLRGVRLLHYLDDWLVIAESQSLLLQYFY